MKMNKKIAALLAMLMMLLACTAAGAEIMPGEVVQLELPFGQNINSMPLGVEYDGHFWSLEDRSVSFKESVTLYGGKSHAIYEMTVPAELHLDGAFEGNLKLGRLAIDIFDKTHLQILEGNRVSGEFVLIDSMDLVEPYVETVKALRDEDEELLLIDRLYLNNFTENGEEKYYAASFFINYDGYVAVHPPLAKVEQD